MKGICLIPLIATIIGMIVIFISMCFSVIEVGHIGFKVRLGAIQGEALQEGLHVKSPIESIKAIDCRTKRIDVEGEGASKDLQTVNTYIAVNYKVNREKAIELYKTVGMDYEDILIRPATQEAMKVSIAKYTAEEIITKRAEVANVLLETLKDKLKLIDVENVSIVNLEFSKAYNDAIERKQVAEQEAKKAEQELEKAKIEAEKKVVEAQAEADSLKAQKQEITQDLLEFRRVENESKWIEKWDGKLPTTMLGENIPMLNLN